MTSPFEYHEPRSLPNALELLDKLGSDAHVLAGGTALVLMIRQGLVRPAHLVSLRQLADLRGITVDGDGRLHIGALTTHSEAEESSIVRGFCPALATAFAEVATVRIRNQATVGGNLVHADPAQDPPPMLLALDAHVRIVSSRGERRLPLDQFFRDVFETALEPTEILCEVVVPPPPAASRAIYVKYLPGTQDAYATISVAVVLALDEAGRCTHARIALGAAAPTAIRATEAEQALVGRELSDDAVRTAGRLAAQAADPIDDLRGTADYKRQMVAVWTRRAITSLMSAS